MPITAASVEANGWVLAVTVSGALTAPNTNFGAYVLSPDATPRLAFDVSSPGFVKSAGTAIAGALTRNLVATRPLRRPVDPLAPLGVVLDETDLGGGLIRVRLALSEEVYVGDTIGPMAALAGWRAGEGAATGIAVTNNSTLAPPLPVMRWVLPPYDTTNGVFRVSLIVGAVHPVGFEPVAGVRFTATDGTNVKTVWTTALGTDNTHGDNLRCYTVEFDPAAATAFTAGLLRIDAEVYPFLGAMRSTDPVGTRTMTSLRSTGFGLSAESPWVIGYDPAGTRYGQQWAYVDPVNGTVTASAAMVATTLAGAKAVAPASRPRSVSTAIAAFALQNRTLAAANGQAAQSRAGDGATAVLAPGTHIGINGSSVTTGFTTVEIPLRIIGDPDDPNPRANCVVETSGTSAATRTSRMRWRNLTVLSTTGSLTDSGTSFVFLDNVEVRAKAGSESGTTFPIGTGTPPAGTANYNLTRTRVWRAGYTITSANRFVGLMRACEISRRSGGNCFVRNRWIAKGEDGFTAANNLEGFATNPQSATLGGLEDIVIAYNDMRSMRWAAWTPNSAPAALAGVSPQTGSHRRHVILNNVLERISGTAGVTPTSDTFFGYGEAAYVVMDTIIIEGNTVAGGGYNAFYSDPTPATVADIDSQTNITRRIRHANNATDRNASKHDDFFDPNTNSIRVAAGGAEPAKGGYRPACIGAWSVHFGVGMEAHVDCGRKGSIGDFRREFSGLRGIQYAAPTSPGWVNDRSEAGTDLGGGDYTPGVSSPLLGRVRRANSDRDFAGNARLANGASGALESTSGPALTAANARSSQSVSTPTLDIALGLAAANSGHGQSATEPLAAISFTLNADLAGHGHIAGSPIVGWFGSVAPDVAISASSATESGVETLDVGMLLAPARADHGWTPGTPVLLPDSAALGGGTLNIRADVRLISIQ